jgi:hypothetical protein
MHNFSLDKKRAAHEYLTKFYSGVAGFSSLFSAEVAAVLLEYQNENLISGGIGEIGVFKGRSFIALALHALENDLCLAIDRFSWPSNCYELFLENLKMYGVSFERVVSIAKNTQDLKADEILSKLNNSKLRYLHVDGGHEVWILDHDLELSINLMTLEGILCLDDMLHPMYPELGGVVHNFLARNPRWCVFCVVDRADIIAASKYLLCAVQYSERYKSILRASFPKYVFAHEAEFATSRALILSKDTALQPMYDKLIHL